MTSTTPLHKGIVLAALFTSQLRSVVAQDVLVCSFDAACKHLHQQYVMHPFNLYLSMSHVKE